MTHSEQPTDKTAVTAVCPLYSQVCAPLPSRKSSSTDTPSKICNCTQNVKSPLHSRTGTHAAMKDTTQDHCTGTRPKRVSSCQILRHNRGIDELLGFLLHRINAAMRSEALHTFIDTYIHQCTATCMHARNIQVLLIASRRSK